MDPPASCSRFLNFWSFPGDLNSGDDRMRLGWRGDVKFLVAIFRCVMVTLDHVSSSTWLEIGSSVIKAMSCITVTVSSLIDDCCGDKR